MEECDLSKECKKIILLHYVSNHLPARKIVNMEFVLEKVNNNFRFEKFKNKTLFFILDLFKMKSIYYFLFIYFLTDKLLEIQRRS